MAAKKCGKKMNPKVAMMMEMVTSKKPKKGAKNIGKSKKG